MSAAILPAPTARATVTPDDLLRMGDEGKRCELANGELEELNPSVLSSYVAGQVSGCLRRFVDSGHPGWVVPGGASFQCFADDEGKVRRPDTAFIALDRLTAQQAMTEGHCPVVPDLVVEVISPNDYAKLVSLKIEEWLRAGVRLVWLVNPDAKTVHAYRGDGTVAYLHETDTLTGEPVLAGFAVPVADLFRLPAGLTSPRPA